SGWAGRSLHRLLRRVALERPERLRGGLQFFEEVVVDFFAVLPGGDELLREAEAFLVRLQRIDAAGGWCVRGRSSGAAGEVLRVLEARGTEVRYRGDDLGVGVVHRLDEELRHVRARSLWSQERLECATELE